MPGMVDRAAIPDAGNLVDGIGKLITAVFDVNACVPVRR